MKAVYNLTAQMQCASKFSETSFMLNKKKNPNTHEKLALCLQEKRVQSVFIPESDDSAVFTSRAPTGSGGNITPG